MESSKTDQYWENPSLVIAHMGELTCPVGMMEKYFSMGELEETPKEVRVSGNNGDQRRQQSGKLSLHPQARRHSSSGPRKS